MRKVRHREIPVPAVTQHSGGRAGIWTHAVQCAFHDNTLPASRPATWREGPACTRSWPAQLQPSCCPAFICQASASCYQGISPPPSPKLSAHSLTPRLGLCLPRCQPHDPVPGGTGTECGFYEPMGFWRDIVDLLPPLCVKNGLLETLWYIYMEIFQLKNVL